MVDSTDHRAKRARLSDDGMDDDGASMFDDDQDLFEYEDDSDSTHYGPATTAQRASKPQLPTLVISSSDDDDDGEEEEDSAAAGALDDSEDSSFVECQTPPELAVNRTKGKFTSRKQFQLDAHELATTYRARYRAIQSFECDDDTIRISLRLKDSTRTLSLALMFPDLGGYPKAHTAACYAENDLTSDEEAILEEVAALPPNADRSVPGLVNFIVSRLVHNEPSPWVTFKDHQDSDAESDVSDLVQISAGTDAQFKIALAQDFKQLKDANYCPGFTSISDFDKIISVSKRVNTLKIPPQALEAWDPRLLTGEIVYLVLLINLGSKYPPELDNPQRDSVKFKIGISPRYKPSKQAIAVAFRSHAYTEGDFEAVSLSSPLNSLMNDAFQRILLTRRRFSNCGWAAAEDHCLTAGREKADLDEKAATLLDMTERNLSAGYSVPADPMDSPATVNNFPMVAFAYLLRRFVMCPRFCLVCHKAVESHVVALKAFVCSSSLCLFQYMSLGLGPSLEHEIITNATSVDLLLQLTYIAAKDRSLCGPHEPLGLSLEASQPFTHEEYDALDLEQKCFGVAALIDQLPDVSRMKAWLEGEGLTAFEQSLNVKRRLFDMDSNVSPSAWKLLRWIVASNTSYLKKIDNEDELIQGVPVHYQQFRLVTGSPAQASLHDKAVREAQAKDVNARQYPTLWAWHGSSVKNWHSILRGGLVFKDVAVTNGRAYGHGVYFAKTGEVSLGHYAQNTQHKWKSASQPISKMAALCELVNQPQHFVSTNPYYVVDKTEWIQCRYLVNEPETLLTSIDVKKIVEAPQNSLVRPVQLDPKQPFTLNGNKIVIPDLLPKLEALEAKLNDAVDHLNDSDDEIVHMSSIVKTPGKRSLSMHKRASQLTASQGSTASALNSQLAAMTEAKAKDTFVPASAERLKLVRGLPPPGEMKQMIKTQEALGPTAAGFYYDPERSGDNMFTMIVEMIGFDPQLPLSKDMKAKGVSSLLFEIRFGDTYPMSAPFFRIIHPRLLSFAAGGGGHVTAGGSLCMDLLTPDGWNPVYQIEAVLLQIRLAISNLDPRPARLDPRSWNTPYSMSEAIEGFKRAAATHGWSGECFVRFVPNFCGGMLMNVAHTAVPDDLNKFATVD
ncbi:hypothetical protein OIO90_003733 [Microbotryomycetes sp. JL221]|nr:hypothetical protein OIO90_003733 [Microbotryomycetes sp. JL221]